MIVKNILNLIIIILLCIGIEECGTTCTFCKENRNDPLVIKLTPSEVRECERTLREVTKKKLPENLEGSILFDGCVIQSLRDDREGQSNWIVKVICIYSGKEYLDRKEVKLTTPLLKNGGAQLELGKKYRILCSDVYGKREVYVFWNGTVIELQERSKARNKKK